MAEIPSQKSCVGYLCGYNEAFVECCYCRGSMNDPVMLQCLHNCCRSCIEANCDGTDTSKVLSSVQCPVCGDTTEHGVLMSNGFLYNYKRLSALCSEVMNCMTCDAEDVAEAVYWCADCCLCLCENDYVWHNRFHQRHRSAELEAVRTWPVSQLTPAVQCSKHKRQIDMYCFTCGTPKCQRCCYESCSAGKHYWQPHAHEEAKKQLYALIANIRASKERLSRAVVGLQQKCQDTKRRLHGLRMKDGCGMLVKHRRFLKYATVNAFDTTVGVVCTNLERIWCVCTTVLGSRSTFRDTVILARNHIEGMLSVDGFDWLNLLRECFMLKKIVNRSICDVFESLRRRRKYWQENGSFSIDGSLSLTSDIVLRSCLGATHHRRAAQRAPLQFSQASVSFQMTVACWDLALTRDGHVLLAAREHGLLMYSDRGQQLSSWRPERQSDGEDDEIDCVAALSDGRAAVGVYYAQLVVLLKLSQTGDTWLQDRRVAVLQSPPHSLAVHDDLLVAAEDRYEQQQLWVRGPVLKLLRLSSGQVLYTDKRDYDIERVALTALCVVTTSLRRVKRNSGATPYVLDAFTHSGGFLWRHETSDEEYMFGLCVSVDSWSRLYVAVLRDRSSFGVMAFGGADGRGCREVMSSRTRWLLDPAYLSLARGQKRTVLAVLSWDRATRQFRSVSLYEAKVE